MLITTKTRYLVTIPGTDIQFLVEWTGVAKCDGSEFLLRRLSDGFEFAIPAECLQDMVEVN